MLKCRICGYEHENSILSHVRQAHGMSSKEYRSLYGEPLRASHVATNPKAMERFRQIGRQNQEKRKGKPSNARVKSWSRMHDFCILCKKTSSPHQANGLCKKCDAKLRQRQRTKAKNELLLAQPHADLKLVTCRICGKPFESLTTKGHLSTHGITQEQYLEQYPCAPTTSLYARLRKSAAVSKGRKVLMKRRGYLNPPSQRRAKSVEMSRRHQTKDFAKVSKSEMKVASWFYQRGYEVRFGDETAEVTWQHLLLDSYCVDFFVKEQNLVIEVLGTWWHGKNFSNFYELHPAVKRNIVLDQRRFVNIQKDYQLIKIWDDELDGLNEVLGPLFPHKSERDVEQHFFYLSDLPPHERWNAMWLTKSLSMKPVNGILNPREAELLLPLLKAYGNSSAVPKEIVDRELAASRQAGFPHYVLEEDEKTRLWHTVANKAPSISWDGYGTQLATSFHPHMFECRRRGKMSPVEFFNSDEDLRRGIAKVLCLYGKVTPAKIREICRNEAASSRVCNSPPMVAKTLVTKASEDLKKEGLEVLDPCAGFSGRMIGCGASGLVSRYVGIDLSPKTAAGLQKTVDFLKKVECGMSASVIEGDCLKEMSNMTERFDVILTSPPFLDVEEYVGVSVERDYKRWLETFVRPFLQGCFRTLNNEGLAFLYVEKIRGRNFPEDLSELAEDVGFTSLEPVAFAMSSGEYGRAKQTKRQIKVVALGKGSF